MRLLLSAALTGTINATGHDSRIVRTRSQSARQGYNAQARSWDKGLYAFMGLVLSTDHGQAVYPRRMATVEPVFGQLKHNRGFQRFLRRGRSAALSEW